MTQKLYLAIFMQSNSVIHHPNILIDIENDGHLHFRDIDTLKQSGHMTLFTLT